ncbi:MAG: DUF1565 domain-containing protein [Candidatus Neomarinimicrobiota bacterium]
MKNFRQLLSSTLLLYSFSSAETFYVPEQFELIQDAISNSSDNDSIIVAPGVYNEKINFDGKSIVLSSRFILDNDSLLIGLTIIDAQTDVFETGSVVTFQNEESNSSILQGFTIQNGTGNFEDPDDNGSFYTYGGGLYIENSSPVIKSCIIKDNVGNEGGGGGIFCFNSSPKFFGCYIQGNETDDVGGGIYSRNNSSPEFYNTTFSNNTAEFGGACYLRDDSSPIMENVILMNNSANNSGGGIILKDDANLIASHIQIKGNTTDGLGGGLYINNADPTFNFSLIVNNVSSSGGGCYIRNESYVHLTNVTIANNDVGLYGNGIYLRDGSTVNISSSILWGTVDNQIYFREDGSEQYLNVFYSAFKNGIDGIDDNDNGDINWGAGNIEEDPQFCNDLGGNYSVRESSPCVESGAGGSMMGCLEPGCGPINTGPIWFVDLNGNDTSDGSLETPFETINRAIDVAVDGDTIRLNPGNYIESFNFEGKEIVIESRAFDLDDSSMIEATCFLPGPVGGSSFTLQGNQNNDGTLRGLTFKGGSDLSGGGIKIENCSPTLNSLVIEGNNSEIGGGLYLYQSDAVLKDLIIRNNTANLGGGLYVTNGDPYIENIIVQNNISYWGGGIYFENSNPIIYQSRFRDNQALIEGAGIYIYGGNLQLDWSSFENNVGNDFGGGLVGNQSIININQTTFTGNVSGIGSVFALYGSTLDIKNSIIWGNNGEVFYVPETSGLTNLGIQYSNIQGGESVYNEFSNLILDDIISITDVDPQFCDPSNNLYNLSESSPCQSSSDQGGIIGGYDSSCDFVSLKDYDIQPNKIQLHQNYPNPFNPITNIKFFVPKNTKYELIVYNIQGHYIKFIDKGIGKDKFKTLDWNATNSHGQKVPSGVYIVSLEAGFHSKNIKMLLLK